MATALELTRREIERWNAGDVEAMVADCDPDVVDYVIPGNDDALRAIKLFTSRIADAVIAGRDMTKAAIAGPAGNGGPARKVEPEFAAAPEGTDAGAPAPSEATPPPA